MQGQANHFLRYNLSDLPEQYSKDRYINETRRLYRTIDKHFQDSKAQFLVGDKPTIADIAISSWANILGGFLRFPALISPAILINGEYRIRWRGDRRVSPRQGVAAAYGPAAGRAEGVQHAQEGRLGLVVQG